jgi:hypothetical protein
LPAETGVKMKTGLMERCKKMFVSSDVNSDSGVIMKKPSQARNAEMLKKVFKEPFKQQEK